MYRTTYIQRNDHEPGYIYLMEAKGYHGLIPGCFLHRCKIGLSRNPQMRLQNFHDNQPPCDIKIVKTIYVEDMEAVETELHRQFKECQVKLVKSREWFDLYPWQFATAKWSMSRYDSRSPAIKLPIRLVLVCLVALVGVGVMLVQEVKQESTSPQVESSAR